MPQVKTDKFTKGVVKTTDNQSQKADPAAAAFVKRITGQDPNDVKGVVNADTPAKVQIVPEPPELLRRPIIVADLTLEDKAPAKPKKRIPKVLAETPESSVRKGPRPIPDEPSAEVERPLIQPAEIVLGRYYEVTYKDGRKLVGELVETEGATVQHIEPWVEGRPTTETVKVFFGSYDVREITREATFELSHSHIHAI